MKRVGSVWQFVACGLDLFDPIVDVPSGTLVRVTTDKRVGRPRSPFAYVETLDGQFLGMVLESSLQKREKR